MTDFIVSHFIKYGGVFLGGDPAKTDEIIKFGRHLVEGIPPIRRLDQGIGRLQQKHYYINGLILNFKSELQETKLSTSNQY
jgi:hypothetical protein